MTGDDGRWHRTLQRQLRRVGLDADAAAADAALAALLDRVSSSYDDVDQERYLNDRAFALSSREMQDLYDELRRASASELALERDRLQAVFDAVATGLVVLGPDGVVLRANPAAEVVLGAASADIVGRTVGEVLCAADDDTRSISVVAGLLDAVAGARAWRVQEASLLGRSGRTFTASLVFAPLLHQVGHGGGVLAVTDISERKEVEAELAWRATHDQLTGLLNRAAMADRLAEALQRDSERRSHLALMFLDLDRFKLVNDTLGHAIGDALLIAVAGRLESTVRDADRLARLGGDEFVVLLEPTRGPAEAMLVADRIVGALSAPFEIGDERVYASASVGVAMAAAGDSTESLLRNADVALYRAKDRGRNRSVLFDPSMHDQVAERVRLERQLRHALDAEDLSLVYQPTWAATGGRLVGFEALVRWVGPEGPVEPSVFVTLAEDAGLVGLMGDWVLSSAGGFLADLAAAGRPDLTVAVNLSAMQLPDDRLPGRVLETIAESTVAPDRLLLEITETALLSDPAVARARLEELRATGARIALDDFGTGYSSLSSLREFPLDSLKMDRSFLTHVATSPRDRAIVTAIVALGRALHMTVVAEGVETQEQLDVVRELGCDIVQGYLLAPPMLRHEALALARRDDASPAGRAPGRPGLRVVR